MNNQNVRVFVNQGDDQDRRLLLLAPQVAARLGWSNGRVISGIEAMDAEFFNAMHILSEGVKAAYDDRYENPPSEQQEDLPPSDLSKLEMAAPEMLEFVQQVANTWEDDCQFIICDTEAAFDLASKLARLAGQADQLLAKIERGRNE